jgi:MscS family membrane protein
MTVQDVLNGTFFGNSIQAYLLFLAIILAGLIFKRVISQLLSRLLFRFIKKYAKGIEASEFVELLTKPISLFILLITVYLAFDRLEFPHYWKLVPAERPGLRMFLSRSFEIALILSLTWIVLRMVDFFTLVLNYKARLTEAKANDQLIPFFKEVLKILVIIISFFFILGFVFNLNITSLVAGLGIGGLAIALAAKESLENLLGSFTIFFDKPFVIGDLVQVGNITGNVERIGFRSTRIRTLEKSFVTVPNKKMVDAELDNLTLRMQRRAEFVLHLSYESNAEQIRSIIRDIKQLLDTHSHTDHKEGRVHFLTIGNSSLDITVSYYVNTSNADIFMVAKEEINFGIMEIIARHGCTLAYPTKTLYLHQTH